MLCRVYPPSSHALKERILAHARDLGFALAGVAHAGPAETREAYLEWVRAGYSGEMAYLARDPGCRTDPRQVWPESLSVLVVGMNYRRMGGGAGSHRAPRTPGVPGAQGDGSTRDTGSPTAADPRAAGGRRPDAAPSGSAPRSSAAPRGRVAQYALGDDYHTLMRDRLGALLDWVRQETGPEVWGRACVDTAPILERDAGARAGLGWFGKNTCLLNRSQGSYFFLGALLLSLPLPPDEPVSAHCGTCRRCLDICPTRAFVAPYVLDARRCISYLTIELRGPIPRELRTGIGDWIFGCDLCQEVCPWNRKAPGTAEAQFAPRSGWAAPELIPLLSLTQSEFSTRFRNSAVKRTRRRGLLRNVCVALGNSGDPVAIPPLVSVLNHEEPLVRGHAAWALGRLGGPAAADGLRHALAVETDAWVREELELALSELEK